MTTRCPINVACRLYEKNLGKAVGKEENLCDEVEIVREYACLGNRMSAD